MSTLQVIETLCRIIEEAIGAIQDEETKRQIEAAYNEAIGQENRAISFFGGDKE